MCSFGRKMLSLLIVCAMIISLGTNVFASAITSTEKGIEKDIITDQVSEMVPLMYEHIKPDTDKITIGNQLFVYRVTEAGKLQKSAYESYPLIINATISGIIDVSRNANGDLSQVSLGIDYASELQTVLNNSNQSSFAIIHGENGVYLKFENSNTIHCLKSYIEPVPQDIILFDDTIAYGSLSLSEGEVIRISESQLGNIRATNTTLYKTLSISNVSNTSTTCCPAGICWAASIAIMANYHCGTSYTALQVHDACGCLTSNYHSEEKSYIRQLGMYSGGPYYSTGNYPFCFSTLADCIDADMLLLLDYQDYDEAVAHNVVAYGYYATSSVSTTYFYYMDPNTGRKLSSFPASPRDTVCVSLGGYNYEVHCYITAY